eukprot:jgi/Pico_ML_1/51827/g2671.t1
MGADLEASMPVSDPQNKDGVCYFPRDLSRGKYGGDVFCLQKFLKKKASQAISPAKGYFGYSSRQKYAKTDAMVVEDPFSEEGLDEEEEEEELAAPQEGLVYAYK